VLDVWSKMRTKQTSNEHSAVYGDVRQQEESFLHKQWQSLFEQWKLARTANDTLQNISIFNPAILFTTINPFTSIFGNTRM